MINKILEKKRYVIVGTGSRASMYIEALTDKYSDRTNLVAFCDSNLGRMEYHNQKLMHAGRKPVPTYHPNEIDQLFHECNPDIIIVTTGPDRTHSKYIVKAMRMGCDVITEKPITIDMHSTREILRAQKETGRNIQVTFNYRYAPPRAQVRSLIQNGEIGSIISVNFTWYLNTRHGADYFRRWHRKLENSGSLLIHKAAHHFDLVNWWINDRPEQVTAIGAKQYYNEGTAERLGLTDHGDRCLECRNKTECPFYLDLREDGQRELYLNNEKYDGYIRDSCVFSPEINIWDTMSATVSYVNGVQMSYSLNAFSPEEGYSIVFNGTKGRLDHSAIERSYVSGDGNIPGELRQSTVRTRLLKEFSEPVELEVETRPGGHGGGDPLLLEELFGRDKSGDSLSQRADHMDGVWSMLVGLGACQSIQSGGKPVILSELL